MTFCCQFENVIWDLYVRVKFSRFVTLLLLLNVFNSNRKSKCHTSQIWLWIGIAAFSTFNTSHWSISFRLWRQELYMKNHLFYPLVWWVKLSNRMSNSRIYRAKNQGWLETLHLGFNFTFFKKDLTTVDMEDLKHTGSSIMGFTILDIKNYELAKSSGELNQVCYWKTIFANSSKFKTQLWYSKI